VIVDFHCHLVPAAMDAPVPPLLRDVEGFLERKANEGIDHAVVVNAMVNLPGSPVDNLTLESVKHWNEFGLDLAERHRDRVSVFVGVNPFGGEGQLEEARRAVGAGSRGLTINSSVAGRRLDDASLEDFWALAEELDVPVFVHPQGGGAEGGVADPRLLEFGARAIDVGLSLAAAIFAGVLDRHPRLRLIAGAGAGGLASLAGRLDVAFRMGSIGPPGRAPAPEGPEEPPSAYLRRIWVDTLLFSAPALRCVLEVFGPERMLFGTDSPPFGMPAAVSRMALDALGLEDAARERILGANGAELLGL
jgi:aminocarboxymuconate-semialdehyde decarboxylase